MVVAGALERQALHHGADAGVVVCRVVVGLDVVYEVGAVALEGEIHLAVVGDVEHRCYASVVRHEGYVYRKFVVSLDELDCSVERVYEKEEIPVAAFVVVHLASLLAQDGYAGRTEKLLDGGMGDTVGYGDGRAVALESDVVVVYILVYLHYGRAGLDCRIETLRHEMSLDLFAYLIFGHHLLVGVRLFCKISHIL